MNRWRNVLLVAVTISIAGCAAAGQTTSTSPAAPTSPDGALVSCAPTSNPTAGPTPMPTLASTTVKASEAPAGAIPMKMTAVDEGPRFKPEHVTAKAGTVVFFLENVPGTLFSPDHNMQIGPCGVQFYGDGSIRTSQMLAGDATHRRQGDGDLHRQRPDSGQL